METIRKLAPRIGIVSGLIACLVSMAYAQQPKSYPLMCKGGGDYTIQMRSGVANASPMNYTFKKGRRAATAGLRPGECTWMDRGFRDNEPAVISFDFKGVRASTNIRSTNGTVIPIFQYAGSNPGKGQLRNIIRKIIGGGEFQVYVYSDGRVLKVTKIGP